MPFVTRPGCRLGHHLVDTALWSERIATVGQFGLAELLLRDFLERRCGPAA
jgi:hypothetical protein